MSGGFDPLVPREIDRPTVVPLDADVTQGEVAALLDDAKIFVAPSDPADLPAWRTQLERWREGARTRHGASTRYTQPESQWASRCFTVAQVWLWDELFFDVEAQRFTPERFLADAQDRFGGLDGVVLWHAYPVIGIDDRNQWDFYDVPGLEEAAAALHAAGVAVFVDYNPWDTGTRRSGDDATELAATVRRLGADGVFLDTLRKADPDLVAALDAARPGIGLEGESKLATERIADHTLSWAQWFADSEVPGVLRAHWFERRHMQHHIRRWHRDHAEELRSAWLNGVGVMVWEVVFGVWVGWNARDAATLRRMLPVQRGFHDWLVDGAWTPLAVHRAPVFGSTFERDGVTLLLLANTADADAVLDLSDLPGAGRWIVLHAEADGGARDGATDDGGARDGAAADGGARDGAATVTVPAGGIAAAVRVADGARVPAVIDEVRAQLASERPETDASFPHRRARRLAAPAFPRRSSGGAHGIPGGDEDTVEVPPGEHVLTVRFRQRETGMYDGSPYVDEWKPLPPRLHDQRTLERVATIGRPVRVAVREVSEAEYARFLDAIGEGAASVDGPGSDGGPGSADARASRDPDRPATGVTFARAREYAAWVGGRLPTEDEWQLAASVPGFARRTPEVWNWTESEHSDGRTRFVMLKGGSAHVSEGSDWYVDGGVRSPEFALKFLLPGLGQDASPSIGFRVCWEEAP